MESIKIYTYEKLCKILIGHKARFKSDCEFFPNFDIKGRVLGINIGQNNEYLIKVKTNSGKIIDIGSNMSHLEFVVLF